MSNRQKAPKLDKEAREAFHRNLQYLIDCGLKEVYIAAYFGVSRSTVNHWLLRDPLRLDKSVIEEISFFAKGLKERVIPLLKMFSDLNEKFNEVTQGQEHLRQVSLDYLHERKSYSKIIEIPSTGDVTKVYRWHKKINKPRPEKVGSLRVPNDVETMITAKFCGETGFNKHIFHEVYPIVAPWLPEDHRQSHNTRSLD